MNVKLRQSKTLEKKNSGSPGYSPIRMNRDLEFEDVVAPDSPFLRNKTLTQSLNIFNNFKKSKYLITEKSKLIKKSSEKRNQLGDTTTDSDESEFQQRYKTEKTDEKVLTE